MYGPDITFLGVPAADLEDPASFGDAGAVVIGAPFDGGTSHRAGCRFGPQAIRVTDYLPHDGRRPHLALDVDPLVELGVVDVGDVEMPPGDTEESLRRLDAAVTTVARSGAMPVVLGGDHTVAFPDATGVARAVGWGRV
ncbi:MAG: arginase family protein, partial [Acidimicrobiales bacterium]